MERHATEIGERKKILTAGKQNQGLRDRDEPKLTNLGKKDEQHQLHSLAGCSEKNSSRRLWFATLESKEMNKRKGRTRRGLSKAGTADRECNVEHMQAAADSNGREKLARLPGLGNREKKD